MRGGQLEFVDFSRDKQPQCLGLFDLNCPDFFAPNERQEYQDFLQQADGAYQLGFLQDELVAAFGLGPGTSSDRARIQWIMVHPARKGQGVGSQMLAHARSRAVAGGAAVVDIAASHLSAPFFARAGAREVSYQENGWGEGMHRVDMEWGLNND